MLNGNHNSSRSPSRVLGAILALMCLWLGTGGVLHHTDDLAYSRSMATLPSIQHVTPIAPPDECAACEWTQGLQTGAPATFQVPIPVDSLDQYRCFYISADSAARPIRKSPRAPPHFLS